MEIEGKQLEWEVFDPNAEYEVTLSSSANRLKDLNNKRIGLYWNGKPDGNVLLNAIADLLRERFAGVEFERLDIGYPLSPERKRQIADKSSAVIAAIGD